MTNKFKNSNGVLLLQALFFETAPSKDTVVYTLKNTDHNGYPSLYRLYMEADDPTEYTFAMEHLDSWEHWEALCNSSFFKPYIEKWRRELEVRQKARALAQIKAESLSGSRNSFAASKYLLERGWEPKDKDSSKRGRPSKEEIKAKADEIFKDLSRVSGDFDRLKGLQ